MAVSEGISAGLGLGTAIYGAIKGAKANKLAKQNLANRPVYKPLPEDDNELNLAKAQADQGMSDASRTAYLNNANNGLATSISAIQKNGGDANAIGSAYGGYNTGINNLAMYDDQARQNHIGTLLNTYSKYNSQRRGDSDKEFQVNQYAPWADKQQLYGQQKQSGQQLAMQGLSTLGSAIGAFGKLGGGGGAQGNPDTVPIAPAQTASLNPMPIMSPSAAPLTAPQMQERQVPQYPAINPYFY